MPDSGDALFGTGTSGVATGELSRHQSSNVASDLKQLYLIARDSKRLRYDTWMRNYRLVNNRLGGVGQSSNWMPAPRDSEIYPGLSSLVAWMTDQEISIDLIPAADPSSQMFPYVDRIAQDLNDVLYTTWMVEDYDSQIKLTLWDALMYGLGVFKNVWDAKLAGGYGNAVIRRVDPWSFYPDPNATSTSDMEYCVEVRRVSVDELQRRFPDTWSSVVKGSGGGIDGFEERPSLFQDQSRTPKANPGTIPQSGQWPGSSPGISTWGSSTTQRKLYEPLPGYVLYEFWLRTNIKDNEDQPQLGNEPANSENRVRDEWRLVCMCNNEILIDCPATDLWSHGQHPYERYVFDDIGEFFGISLVDHLAYPQIYINRLLTALQYNIELTGNPIFVEAQNSGLGRVAIINRPGQRLTVNGPAAMQNRPDWLTPPSMPPQTLELIQFWMSRIENTLGLSALQKGITPTQRNAEGALNMVQEAAFVRVRSALTNLQASLQRCGVKIADLIVDNYDEPRIMAMIGDEGDMVAKMLGGRHFMVPSKGGMTPLEYVIRIEAGASGPTSRNARTAEADALFALGTVDDEYVLQRHRVRNYQQVLQRLYDKRAKGVLGTPGKK